MANCNTCHINPVLAAGLCSKCYWKKYYQEHKPAYAKRAAKYRETAREKHNARSRASYKQNPKYWKEWGKQRDKTKTTAVNAANRYFNKILPCEVCGTRENIEKHHEDYTKPLKVRWLCRKHHRELHKKY